MNQHDQMRALIDAAEEDSKNYEDDPRPDVRCDVMNAFFRGANWQKKQALSYVNETPKNEHDSNDVLNKTGNVDMMREALRMIDTIIDAAFDGGNYDGGEIQDMAVEHGLLKQEEMKEPCAGNCTCLEAGAEFPTQCYRKTYKQALAAEKPSLVRLTEYELIGLMYDTNALPECEPTQKELIEFANAIMNAMERVNGGQQ